jgi:Lhr-like helicase
MERRRAPIPKLNHSRNAAHNPAQVLELFHPAVRDWFGAVFAAPTRPQISGWPAIARGESTLILAPTGTGKTLAAFLWRIHRIMFTEAPAEARRCRVLYISPIKALAVDVERNLRAPLVGIAQSARNFILRKFQCVPETRRLPSEAVFSAIPAIF